MQTFHIKIVTKLGSTQYKSIQAENETEALRKAKAKFPLHKEIFVSEEPPPETKESAPDPAFERNLAEVKLRSQEKKAKGAKKEGWGFLIGGVLVQGTLWALTGYIILWLAIPIIWGVARISFGSAELNRVQAALQELDAPA